MKKLIAIFLLCFSVPSFAALGSNTAWNVDVATGNDSYPGGFDPGLGSPETDATLTTGVAFSDLIVGATTTQATSVTLAFSSTTHGPGNTINITGGTGCTTGIFVMTSQSAGTGTFDRSLGTAASVCSGYMGGKLLTISQAITNSTVDNMTVWVKYGTYTITTALAPSPSETFRGYTTTKGDLSGLDCASASCPTVTTATNSVNLFNLSSNKIYGFYNFNLTNTAATRAIAIKCNSANSSLIVERVIMDGTKQAVDSGGSCSVVELHAVELKNMNTGSSTIVNCGNPCVLADSSIHDNSGTSGLVFANSSSQASTLLRNNFYNNSFSGSSGVAYLQAGKGIVSNNNFVSNTATTTLNVGTDYIITENNVFYANVGNAVDTGTARNILVFNNAFGSNSTDGTTGTGAITGIGDPFVSKSTGNFALNTTAGAGALLRGAGFPGVFPGGTTTGYISIGAAQPSTSGGGSGGSAVQTTVQN